MTTEQFVGRLFGVNHVHIEFGIGRIHKASRKQELKYILSILESLNYL